MNKIMRTLLLYSRLVQGERINKLSFCMETDCLPRTFDRDVQDVRLYLSELFQNEELVYDRQEKVYFFSSSQRRALGKMEYLFMERVLIDTRTLRTDEMDGLLKHLASNAEDRKGMLFRAGECMAKYNEPPHGQGILKLHGDLAEAITNSYVIQVNYIEMNGEAVERQLLPCEIRCDLGCMYLIAFMNDGATRRPACFRLDRIQSFSIICSQRTDEMQRVADYLQKDARGVTPMYGGESIEVLLSCKREFLPCIYDNFQDVHVVDENEDMVHLRLAVFDKGFVKWIMNQPVDVVQVLEPREVKQKILNEAKRLVEEYAD